MATESRPVYHWGRIELVPNGEFRQPEEGEFFLNSNGEPLKHGEGPDCDGYAHGWRAILVPKADDERAVSWDDGDDQAQEGLIVVCGNCLAQVEQIELKATREVTHYFASSYGIDEDDLNDEDEDRASIQERFDAWVADEFRYVSDWNETDTYQDPYQDGGGRCECPECGHESDHDDPWFFVTTETARKRAETMKTAGLPQHEVTNALCFVE